MISIKGVVLFSGGLDSLLAAKILLDQDIPVIGLHCILPYISPSLNPENMEISKYAQQIGLPMQYYRCDKDYLSMISNPPHGYGKNMNPCIDCKIHFLQKARMLMNELNADFVATGEVIGQRPMSQMKHMLRHIEKESGLLNVLVRPLSAKLLPPTTAEQKGIIQREKLHGISGRGRKVQLELARELGINDYASPAGGCLYTDPNISKRTRDLIDNSNAYSSVDMYLLTIGRHFRINRDLKVIIGRNEDENIIIKQYSTYADYWMVPNFKGPDAYVQGKMTNDEKQIILSLIMRYGKPNKLVNSIEIYDKFQLIESISSKYPIDEDLFQRIRL